VYSDGSHYIAILNTKRKCNKKKEKSIEEIELKEKFENAYAETNSNGYKQKAKEIAEKVADNFESKEKAEEFVQTQMERKRRNEMEKRKRLSRKVKTNDWNYFVTFTYDENLHTEETFKKSLSNKLKHAVSRNKWKYIGVWERSPKTGRLHFHGIFYIPKGKMIGELVEVRDYDTRNHKMRKTIQNTHFNKTLGRSDFEEITNRQLLGNSMNYLTKYLQKDGGKLIYSRNIPTYYISDILEEDIVCKYSENEDDPRVILFDNFNCFNEGTYVGEICTETKEKLNTAN
jgi:hypothetical protein